MGEPGIGLVPFIQDYYFFPRDEGTYKTSIQNMHKLGWKVNYFNSAGISMFSHGCGVSQYPQFNDRTKNISNVTKSICGKLFR